MELFQSNYWMFIGIVEGDVVPSNMYSFAWPGSYGWVLGSSGHNEYEKKVRLRGAIL